jgi:hypothetical protein
MSMSILHVHVSRLHVNTVCPCCMFMLHVFVYSCLLWIITRVFIKDKKYMRNPKESSYCPEAAVGLELRTVSCPQGRLWTGGPKTRDSPSARYSTTRADNSAYNSDLQLLSNTPLYRANYWFPRKIRLPSQLLLLLLPSSTEVVTAYRAENFEKYHFKNR